MSSNVARNGEPLYGTYFTSFMFLTVCVGEAKGVRGVRLGLKYSGKLSHDWGSVIDGLETFSFSINYCKNYSY